MSLYKRPTVETSDGLIHRASYSASDKRLDKRVWRRSVECGFSAKGILRRSFVFVTCLECLAEEGL